MAFDADATVFPFTGAADGGSQNRAIQDAAPASNDDTTQAQFGTTTTTRFIKARPLVAHGTSATPAAGTNEGWNIPASAIDFPSAGGAAVLPRAIPFAVGGTRRFIPAGTWQFQIAWAGSAVDTNAVFKVRAYLHKRSADGVTLTAIANAESTAVVAPASIFQTDTITMSSVPEIVLSQGESLHVEYWIQGRGGGTLGTIAQTITFRLGATQIITMPTQMSYLYQRAGSGSAAPAAVMTKMPRFTKIGAILPTSVISRKALRVFAGAVTPAAVIARRVFSLYAGAVTPAGAVLKRTYRSFTGALTSSAVMSNRFLKSVAGVLTSSGVVTRFAQRRFTALITPAGSVLKLSARRFSGALTSAGSASLRVYKTLTALLTSSGAVSRKAQRALAGTLTSSGVVARLSSLRFTAAITPTSSVLKLSSRLFAGTLTSAGALSRRVFRIFAGSMQPTSTVLKMSFRRLTAVLSSAGSVVVKLSSTFIGSITPAAAVSKKTQKRLSGDLAPLATLAQRQIHVRLYQAMLQPTGSAQKRTFVAVAGVITPQGLAQTKFFMFRAGTITSQGQLQKLIEKDFDASFCPIGVGETVESSPDIVFVRGKPFIKISDPDLYG